MLSHRPWKPAPFSSIAAADPEGSSNSIMAYCKESKVRVLVHAWATEHSPGVWPAAQHGSSGLSLRA